MAVITDLPVELITDILVRLSPQRLLQCVCALKSLNALISSEGFSEAYVKRSLETNNYRTLLMAEETAEGEDFKYPTEFFAASFYPRESFSNARSVIQPLIRPGRVRTEIVGCYNGLVCIHNPHHSRDLAVWNPSIRRFKRIPFSPIEVPAAAKTGSISGVKYGFGYDPATQDYKVVRIYEFSCDRRANVGSEVKVYGLKTKSWKKIESFSCTWVSDRAIPLEGALHWVGKLEPLSDGLRVLALDLGKEVFKEFRTPFRRHNTMDLEVLNGKLCMGVFVGFSEHDIWEMEEYGVSESWIRLYTFREGIVDWGFEYLTPLALSRTGKGILMHDRSVSTDGNLFWYDPKKNTGKAVQFLGMPKAFAAAVCVANIGLLDGDPVIRQQQLLPIKRKSGSRKIFEGEGSTEKAKQGDLT
ncbi:PREDICTED: F-box protein CPR30-like [Fragaria vesca subsp. vesca]|uniref:F-box protein CPR30-like n=1 Tax=Fragaria vesca subsp. vesca TaxID=101020 RepID=UPI0002C30141|nr:PREDICTED: F-box protein CPR30-like [Fragaria vesca subsp. vesca]